MLSISESPIFGIMLTVVFYIISVKLCSNIKSSLANPMVLTVVFIILTLSLLDIPISNYNNGGDIIALFLGPATAVLAVSIYRQIDKLKSNILPVLIGTITGSASSIILVFFLCKAFGFNEVMLRSMIPKSVTNPIAIAISGSNDGVVAITVAAVVLTGVFGAVFAPLMIKVFKIDNKIAAGIGIGTSSHALGTSRALEIGDVEGAMSGVAIGIAGLVTVVLSLFIY